MSEFPQVACNTAGNTIGDGNVGTTLDAVTIFFLMTSSLIGSTTCLTSMPQFALHQSPLILLPSSQVSYA